MKTIRMLILFCLICQYVYSQNHFDNSITYKMVELNQPYIVDNVNFGSCRMYCDKEHVKSLDNLSNILKANENINIIIIQHTDNVGSQRYNQRLSEKRSEEVKNYLCYKDTSLNNRILTFGVADRFPIKDNTKPENRADNRRTEIIFYNREVTQIKIDTSKTISANKIYDFVFLSNYERNVNVDSLSINPLNENSKNEFPEFTINEREITNKYEPVLIYQSPLTTGITISIPELKNKYYAQIFDITGKLLVQKNLDNNQNELDLIFLKPSIYILTITNTNTNFIKTYKLIRN